MKIFLAAFFSFLVTSFASAQAPAPPPQIEWFKDYSRASRVAAASARPMLLDFTAVWCKACREMDAIFWSRADVIEAARHFVAVKIDIDGDGKLADRFGVSFLPNIVLTDSWGGALVFHRGFGRRSDSEIIEKLRSVPADFSEIKEAGASVSANKNDGDSLAKLADFYQRKNFYYLSSELYKRLLKQEKNAAERENIALLLGFNFLKIGWSDDAASIFERFRKDFPESIRGDEALYGEFSALAQKNLLAAAEKVFVELKTKYPKSNFIAQAEQNLQAYRLQAK